MLRIDAEPKLASLTSLHLGGRALALVAFSGVRDLDALPERWPALAARSFRWEEEPTSSRLTNSFP